MANSNISTPKSESQALSSLALHLQENYKSVHSSYKEVLQCILKFHQKFSFQQFRLHYKKSYNKLRCVFCIFLNYANITAYKKTAHGKNAVSAIYVT